MERFNNILFVVNRSSWPRAAYERAMTLAARESARLTVLDVSEEVPHQLSPMKGSSKDLKTIGVSERRARLAKITNSRNRKVQVKLRVVRGKQFTEILEQVQRARHDLVILPPEADEGFDRRTLTQLVRKCPCSFLLIKPNSGKRYSRIMAAVDPDSFDAVRNALNTRIMNIAAAMARKERSELHITNAWSAPAEGLLRSRSGLVAEDVGRYVSSVLKNQTKEVELLLSKANATRLKHRVHLVKGAAINVIPELARRTHIDLLIMGTMSRSGIVGWFVGNTAEKILQHVDCSVLIVKPTVPILPSRLKQKPVRSTRRKAVTASSRSKKRVRAN